MGKIAFLCPGQGAQFVGMGADIYQKSETTDAMLAQANQILGFDILQLMLSGSEDELRQTNVAQPAIFIHTVLSALLKADQLPTPEGIAGHSLGEFSGLVLAKCLNFEDGLSLVKQRAEAMQKACGLENGTMAAVMCNEMQLVENICKQLQDTENLVVVPANYNTPAQLVISGTVAGVQRAGELLSQAGAKIIPLVVGGAFHSPLMQPAQNELSIAIMRTNFAAPICPIYQNVDAQATHDPEAIRQKLIQQLTAPVRWQQSMEQMLADDFTEFTELGGRGNVLSPMLKKIRQAKK
jgi:[acyl-carrier-protein] S-malonyltransferase